jgi:hypothetical protein
MPVAKQAPMFRQEFPKRQEMSLSSFPAAADPPGSDLRPEKSRRRKGLIWSSRRP